jgi:hypothetical protein
MPDLRATQVIVARERGVIHTSVACRRLNLNVTDLLALRRRLVCQVLGVSKVPLLSAAEVERALLHKPERKRA